MPLSFFLQSCKHQCENRVKSPIFSPYGLTPPNIRFDKPISAYRNRSTSLCFVSWAKSATLTAITVLHFKEYFAAQ